MIACQKGCSSQRLISPLPGQELDDGLELSGGHALREVAWHDPRELLVARRHLGRWIDDRAADGLRVEPRAHAIERRTYDLTLLPQLVSRQAAELLEQRYRIR